MTNTAHLTEAQWDLIADSKCPECKAELNLYVTAHFRGGANDAWGPDGYAFEDLELLEDKGEVVCSKNAETHFRMGFSDWAQWGSK